VSSAINVRRYTRGVLDYARKTNTLDQWRHDMTVLLAIGEDRTVRYFLEDPRLSLAERMNVVLRSIGDHVSAAGQELLEILIEDRAVRILPQLGRQVLRESDRIEGIARVQVTSAEPLTDDLREQLRKSLGSDGRSVLLEETVDPAIIGGLILREGDRLRDLSVHASLRAMEEQLARV
jgi:F-type H+-transporting ATPase subunit delta